MNAAAHRLYIVDVFAERPYAGNPLAVVVTAGGLSDQTLQRVAAEMNYSETTFVAPVPEADGGYRVRIFTPSREIPFAGHPVLGTAWVVRHHVAPKVSGSLRLNVQAGQLVVTFESVAGTGDAAWFVVPPIPRRDSGRGCWAPISSSTGFSRAPRCRSASSRDTRCVGRPWSCCAPVGPMVPMK
jgi:predicted PhzF superfamily epimerase YddE/YHI9